MLYLKTRELPAGSRRVAARSLFRGGATPCPRRPDQQSCEDAQSRVHKRSVIRDAGPKPRHRTPYNPLFVNEILISGPALRRSLIEHGQGPLLHIPARYYKRIPKFYFIAGILLVITSFNMEDNPLASYLYFLAGVVSVIYAVSVFQARRKQRKRRSPDELRPAPEEEAPVEDTPVAPAKRQEFVNDNPVPAAGQPIQDEEASRAATQVSGPATEDRELPQHGGGVTSPAEPEAKP